MEMGETAGAALFRALHVNEFNDSLPLVMLHFKV